MFDELLDVIKNNNEFIILRHIAPDYDALGSQFGLKEIIELNFDNKKVYVSGEMTSSHSHLGTMDTLTEADYVDKVVIITDTVTRNRIDIEDMNWLQKAKLIIKLDHHIETDRYANINIVDDSYPATCELIADFIYQLNLKINATIASYLYYGLVSDTERFLYRQLSPRTFNMAGFLFKHLENASLIYQNLYRLDDNHLKLKSYIYANYYRTSNNIVYVKLNKNTLDNHNIDDPHSVALWVNSLAEFNNPKIWMLFVETDEYIRAELRSYNYEVNLLANYIGGGGHKQAAGAKLQSWAEVDLFIDYANKCIENS